jgi:hypothetical protein
MLHGDSVTALRRLIDCFMTTKRLFHAIICDDLRGLQAELSSFFLTFLASYPAWVPCTPSSPSCRLKPQFLVPRDPFPVWTPSPTPPVRFQAVSSMNVRVAGSPPQRCAQAVLTDLRTPIWVMPAFFIVALAANKLTRCGTRLTVRE